MRESSGDDGIQTMKSVTRSLTVLETVADRQPVGVGELSRMLGLPKSTVQRILTTLADAGWMLAEGEPTRWRLSPRALAVGRKSSGEVDLREAALDHLRKLSEMTAETIHLCVHDGACGIVLLERIDSPQPVRTFHRLGVVDPLHATASGRAILAFLGPEKIEEYIQQGLPRLTERTIVDPGEVRKELQRVRDLGYAVNNSENRANVCAIGAPVRAPGGFPIASIAMSMPDTRFDSNRVPEWATLIKKSAAAIARSLQP